MAMSASRLADDMLSELKKTFKPDDDKLLKAICTAYATAIVKEITSNALVSSSSIAVNGGTSGAPPYVGPVTGATGSLTDGKIA